MRFIDEVKIQVASGNGGNGCVSFRREKYVPKGGPDGGNGGRGGDIVFQAVNSLNTLVHFRGRRFYQAEHGLAGAGRQCDGRAGEDLVLKVPAGTIIKSAETGQVLADLTEEGQIITLAQGGRGGLGNMFFKSSTHQTPRFAQEGEEGQTIDLQLELKLLADLALVGLPNAGKSTMISRISAARPKVADYPFTTLEPNLGVVKISEDESFVVADIPGLIEDASEGKGLGHRFLKHVERTKALIHLVDISWCLDPYEAYESYITIRQELEKFNSELKYRPEIVVLTKIDALSKEELADYVKAFEDLLDKRVLPVSSVTGENVELLKQVMLKCLNDNSSQDQLSEVSCGQ